MSDADAKFSAWWNERIETVPALKLYERDFSMRDAFRAGWLARDAQLAALRKLCAEAADVLVEHTRCHDATVDMVVRLRAAAKEEQA